MFQLLDADVVIDVIVSVVIAPLVITIDHGRTYQAVMRTQMSLLLSTSWRRHPWMITYLVRKIVTCNDFFFANSHHLSYTEGVPEVVERVVPEVELLAWIRFPVNFLSLSLTRK